MTQKGEIISAVPGKQNPAIVYLASLQSKTSRISQRSALNNIARKLGAADAFSFEWGSLRYEHMVTIQTWLIETKTPGTARRYIAAVRGALKAAWRTEEIDGETYQRAVDIPAIKGSTIAGRMLTMGEINALLKTCLVGPPVRGSRDTAIISLMAGCGLRRNEVTSLDLANIDLDTGKIHLTGYLTGGVREAIDEWLTVRGLTPGPLFYSISKSDEFHKKRMSDITIYEMFRERGQAAGLKAFSPHDLRRSFISHMLNLTDLATVSKLAGHSNPMTTSRYDHRPEQIAADAAALLKISFTKRSEL
jgi:integrase